MLSAAVIGNSTRGLVPAPGGGRESCLPSSPGPARALTQPELRSVVAVVHLVQLGAGQRRVQRAALDDVGELLVADAEPVGEFHGLGDAPSGPRSPTGC